MEDTIYTIGHSTHPIDEFLKILQAHQIGLLVDVRTVPGSRHNPQFNQDELERYLQAHGVRYAHLKELGGLRHTTKASVNTGWRNLSFRGYADYMQTEQFRAGLERLIKLAQDQRTVIMCAESLPWRCHRSLIADALVARSVHVQDIMGEKSVKPHELTPWAQIDGIAVTYPGTGEETEAARKPGKSRSRAEPMEGGRMEELASLHCSPIDANAPRLGKREISDLKPQLPDWEIRQQQGEPRLEKTFRFDDFDQALAFTDRVGALAKAEDHHPAILTQWGEATVSWWTHKINGLHKNDFIMAAKTEETYRRRS